MMAELSNALINFEFGRFDSCSILGTIFACDMFFFDFGHTMCPRISIMHFGKCDRIRPIFNFSNSNNHCLVYFLLLLLIQVWLFFSLSLFVRPTLLGSSVIVLIWSNEKTYEFVHGIPFRLKQIEVNANFLAHRSDLLCVHQRAHFVFSLAHLSFVVSLFSFRFAFSPSISRN